MAGVCHAWRFTDLPAQAALSAWHINMHPVKGKAVKPEPIDLFICTTCRHADTPADNERPGARLYHALKAMLSERDTEITLSPVECLSVCRRPCTVAVSSPSKWTYVIGDLDPAADTDALLHYIDRYAASPSGTPPFKERPEAIRKGVIARIPPRIN